METDTLPTSISGLESPPVAVLNERVLRGKNSETEIMAISKKKKKSPLQMVFRFSLPVFI